MKDCRPGCGACCIAPSITSPIPGLEGGTQLDEQNRCRLFGRPERPAFCGGLQPSAEMCGSSSEQAIAWLAQLEALTTPRNG